MVQILVNWKRRTTCSTSGRLIYCLEYGAPHLSSKLIYEKLIDMSSPVIVPHFGLRRIRDFPGKRIVELATKG